MIKQLANAFRWAARTMGVLLFLFFVFILAGEGIPNPLELKALELLGFLIIAVMFAGIAAAWWNELYGCILIFAGYAGFSLLDSDFNLDNPFIVFFIIGLFYLAARFLPRYGKRTADSTA